MIAAFQRFNRFIEDLATKVHNLNGDTLKICLTETVPAKTDTLKRDLKEIPAGNGYTAGGHVAAFRSGTQVNGWYTLVLKSPAVWTATTGPIGPFRCAVLYNATPSGGPLIGYWDYGSSITLQMGEPFIVDLDQGTGVLTLKS